ncbi:hypothetical protein DYB31_004659 [Aphanomyces astaci]|uniref:EF-hand domain-containing protein n=1 Tax=Aphanomyces astaci TaxID=112090 RepID=A0A397F8F6_APHAT|nr:hypothetical protein DYB31_004659 [Aphanomyces astaci]
MDSIPFCDSNATTNTPGWCQPCPDNGICFSGDLQSCKQPYLKVERACLEPSTVTRDADLMTHLLPRFLVKRASNVLCNQSLLATWQHQGTAEKTSTTSQVVTSAFELRNYLLHQAMWYLGTVLQDRRVLILHGGVPRQNVKLHDLLDIPRFEFDGLRHTNKYMKATPRLTRRDKNMQIISDIVWSDPRVQPGFDESPRGAGIDFGPDITRRFMQTNRLALIVRSHECAPLGYAYPYGEKAGMLVTLFSASNYTKASNMGAIMHIPSDVNLPPSFAQYRASASDHDFVGSNLDGLYSVILDSRELLLSAFEAADVDGRGLVSAQVWQQLMESTLHMAVDWAALQPLVTSVEKDGSVAYVAFLDRYQASASMAAAGGDKAAMNNLYRHRERLEMLFHTIDKDGNGVITMDEFQAALDVLNQHLPRDMLPFEHPSQLMSVLDFTKDNAININEFLESFRLHANLTTAAKWRRAKNKLKAMHHLGMLKTVDAPCLLVLDVPPPPADDPVTATA